MRMIYEHERLQTGVRIYSQIENLWVLPVSEKIIRIVYSKKGELPKDKSLMVLEQPIYSEWNFEENEKEILISTKKLKVAVNKKSLYISYYDHKKKLLMKEPDKGGKHLEEVDVVKPVFDKDEKLDMEVTVDGLRMKNHSVETYVDRVSYHAKLEFEWDSEEAIYGLGSHEEGVLNLRGTHQYVYQQNMKACVPVLISNKGYGILLDNYSFMTFHDDMYGSYVWMEYADEIEYYFIYGEETDEIIAGYYTLTGKPTLLPKWAFGYIQSKERYVDAVELIETVKEYRDREIPLDCIVLDWRSWQGDLWGEKEFDKERFPNPKEMVDRLHEMNAKLMISIWPNMAPGGTNSAQMLEKGYMLANQSTYNAFDEDARALYWKQANEGLFSSGLDAWWCDCTEPFEGDWKGTIKPEPETRIEVNLDEARKYMDPAYVSAYSLLHSQGIYEGQRSVTEEKRVINLTRSSYGGQHRYGTITWSGDTAASWDTLRKQIPAGLNFCITGEPYWTSDIGGFFVKKKEQWFWDGQYEDGHEDLGYRELYLRWFQYGTFLPMFRSHGTDTPREVWRFGEKGSIFYDTLVYFIKLRYQLMSYIYSLSAKVSFHGGAMIKPLGMEFKHDKNTYDIKDQYMFGDSMLVCPVVEPYFYEVDSMEINREKEMKVYLPSGCDWYDFWTNEKHQGGQWITKKVSLENIPVFIKSGSMIPINPGNPTSVEEMEDSSLKLKIYGNKNSKFLLYEDAGDGYGYETGEYAFTTLSWNHKKEELSTDIQGDYNGFIKNKKYEIEVIK